LTTVSAAATTWSPLLESTESEDSYLEVTHAVGGGRACGYRAAAEAAAGVVLCAVTEGGRVAVRLGT